MAYFDIQKFTCFACGHQWIIASDKLITDLQHVQWMMDLTKEHFEICKGESQ